MQNACQSCDGGARNVYLLNIEEVTKVIKVSVNLNSLFLCHFGRFIYRNSYIENYLNYVSWFNAERIIFARRMSLSFGSSILPELICRCAGSVSMKSLFIVDIDICRVFPSPQSSCNFFIAGVEAPM